jgi:biopolymer transport protein ExbD
VVVKGDGRVHYGKVMQVLDMLKRIDITDVGLVTVRAK